jgi:hypothetical protein
MMFALISGVLAAGATLSCSRDTQTNEEGRVILAFESWKSAMLDHQTNRAMAYIPHHVDDYLTTLNSSPGTSPPAVETTPTNSPGVDLLLRTALEKKVPADMRSSLTLDLLLQRITDRRLFNPRDLREIDLGNVSINGSHASAELYYQGTLTALRLPFVKEGATWKIDVMAILPYAEVLMRVDRAIKGQTEAQQVEQLVSKLPSL